MAQSERVGSAVVNLPVDGSWLALADAEEVLDPELPIIDPHHHLWDRPGNRYMLNDLVCDLGSGHNVVATVFVEAGAMYRTTGAVEMRPLGETEMAATAGEDRPRGEKGPVVCAGIVAHADLTLGLAVEPVLRAHCEAGRGRLRGIRQNGAWDAHDAIRLRPPAGHTGAPRGLYCDRRFREGFACLAPLGLSFDAWLFQPQLPDLVDLARAFPETRIVVDHCGGPVRTGPYRERRGELDAEWRRLMAELASCANVSMKIGGLGMRSLGFEFRERVAPPGSSELARLWKPYVEGCIEAFGAARCMFESNFPVDKAYYDYRTCWNAFKRLARPASEDERRNLFGGTAARVYDLPAG